MENEVVTIIPARSGSKRVPNKNIRMFNGYPLIAYSIAASKMSESIERTIVSTDDVTIAEISRRFGAEVPFLRPKEYSTDSSPDIGFFAHAFQWFEKNEGHVPEYFVHLRTVAPLRSPGVVNQAVQMIIDNPEATGLRSVHEFPQPVCKMFAIDGLYLEGLCPDDDRPEYYNLPGQMFEPVYCPSSYVDVVRYSTFRDTGMLHGDKILAFITRDIGDIDTIEQFESTEFECKMNEEQYQQMLEYLEEESK
tara:strand:- start:4505 stop:5254 length:750 start_codon:yes stop_codon:yes gene_type:complete